MHVTNKNITVIYIYKSTSRLLSEMSTIFPNINICGSSITERNSMATISTFQLRYTNRQYRRGAQRVLVNPPRYQYLTSGTYSFLLSDCQNKRLPGHSCCITRRGTQIKSPKIGLDQSSEVPSGISMNLKLRHCRSWNGMFQTTSLLLCPARQD